MGLLILFGLATAATRQTVTVNQSGGNYTQTVTRTDDTWWILAPNPFVVLADAAPVAPQRKVCYNQLPNGGQGPETFCTYQDDTFDPLGDISRAVRDLRAPPNPNGVQAQSTRAALVWPYGMGFDFVLGGFMLYVTTRRLRTPRVRLQRGVRVG